MTAILLGSAGNDPNTQGSSNSIPIPDALPQDPTVLIDGLDSAAVQGPPGPEGPPGPAGADGADGQDGLGATPPEDTVINRTDGLISSVVTATKTVTITRDGNDQIQFVNDGTYLKEIIRTDGVITSIDVTVL